MQPRNLFQLFRKLIPAPPLHIGEVTDIANNIATVELPGGFTMLARGTATVGQKVFVKDGVIDGQAPSLPVEIIEV